MRNKKIFVLGLSVTLAAVTSVSHAKKIFPSDILARDLNYPEPSKIDNPLNKQHLK